MRCFGCAYTEVCACCAEGWHVEAFLLRHVHAEMAVDMSVAATCMLPYGMSRWPLAYVRRAC